MSATPKGPTRILALRHGETAWNVATRIQGRLDVPLNDTGRWQAARLAQALAGEPLTAIYASDQTRAWETAQYLSRQTGLGPVPEKGLRERGFGDFEGRTFAEIEAQFPALARRWHQRDPDFAPTGGESLRALRERVLGTVQSLAAKHPGELIALVSHGGVMDALYRAATHLEIQAPRTWSLGNATINRLLWTPAGFSLLSWAEDHHLNHTSRDESTVP